MCLSSSPWLCPGLLIIFICKQSLTLMYEKPFQKYLHSKKLTYLFATVKVSFKDVIFFLSCEQLVISSKIGFKRFSKHRPSGPMLSISQNVRLFVCLCVCSLLRYRLNVFLPRIPEVRWPIFLKIQNSWGKVMERSGLIFEHFCFNIV